MIRYITKQIFMMRRFLFVAAVWFGLLGAAEPLLACAMNSPDSDCCPTGTQAPCDHNPAPMGGVEGAQACCASAPLGEPAAVSLKKGDTTAQQGAAGGDLPLIALLPALLFIVPPAVLPPLPRITEPADAGGTQIYLRTRRLRL